MSVTTPTGKRRHRSVAVNTRTSDETMYCGLLVKKAHIVRDWQAVNCKSCIKRGTHAVINSAVPAMYAKDVPPDRPLRD